MKLIHTRSAISFAKIKPVLLMVLFVLCIFNTSIVRADTDDQGWYLGAGVGHTKSDLDTRDTFASGALLSQRRD